MLLSLLLMLLSTAVTFQTRIVVNDAESSDLLAVKTSKTQGKSFVYQILDIDSS
jgi:hypothetical protein